MHRCLCIVVSLIVMAGGLLVADGQQVRDDPDGRQLPDPTQVLEQFDVFSDGDALLVPVTIRGRQQLFVIDTGSTDIHFDTSTGHLLGKPIETAALRITSSDGFEKKIASYPNPGASLGKLKLSTADRVYGTDLTRLRRAMGHDLRGIIGMSFLKKHVVFLDSDRGKIVFLRSVQPSRGKALPISYPREFFVGEIGPCIDGEIVGLGKQRFLLDTGLGTCSVLLTEDVFDELAKTAIIVDKGEKKGEAFLGPSMSQNARLASLQVDDFTHRGLLAGRFNDDVNWSETNCIGLQFLLRFNVTFDFPNGRLYLTKSKRFHWPDKRDMSGLRIVRLNKQTVVDWVETGSPAALSGVRPGDVLVKIGDKPLSNLRLHSLRLMLCEENAEMSLTFQRGENEMPTTRHSRTTLRLEEWRQKKK